MHLMNLIRETSPVLRDRSMMETKLKRIAEKAKVDKKCKFTSLMQLVNKEVLAQCHKELVGNKAAGISGITKETYGLELEANINNLVNRMKMMSYKPQMVKRVYIPKNGSDKKRPLGIPEYEDKLVQKAMTKILNAIYEQDFLDSSFGFRPGRGQHDALKILHVYLERRDINFVVDADIKGFFDNVSHDWMMQFLSHRISDPKFLRTITRFLKAGYLEEGKKYNTDKGTPQGGVISPVLANIYLHYVLDLWFDKYSKSCRGQVYMVRYADDFVCCFEYQDEAVQFYDALKERLMKFSLEIAEDKTTILPFGRRQKEYRIPGEKRTFDFLGFTHFCSKGMKRQFRVKRKMSLKKKTAKLKAIKEWIVHNRTLDVKLLMKKLNQKLQGLYNYYCITDSSESMQSFYMMVRRLLFKWLNRRSQRKSFTWAKFLLFLERYPIVEPKVKVSIYELRPEISYIL